MKYSKYSSYRDSGVEWLGDIPEGWNISKIKHLFNLGRGRVIAVEELEDNGVYPVYSSQTKNNGVLGLIETYDYNCRQITWTTDGANAGTVFLREGKHNCTNVCGTLQARNNKDLLEYMTYSLQYSTQFYKRPDTNGAKIMNGEMAEIFTPRPPLQEQQTIANYLDIATAKIDTLIEKQTKLIELLREKRQAVIGAAVTRGLDNTVAMKDSGVEWLGEIPEHWVIGKIKHYGIYRSGDFISANNIEPEGNYPVLGGNGLRGYAKTYNLAGNYALIGRQGALCGNINYSKDKFWATEHAIVVHNNKNIDVRWLGEILRTMNLNQYSVSAAQPGLAVENIVNLTGVRPPLKEQKKIAKHIDDTSSKIDNLISKSTKAIDLLKEKRTALISSAVTGKIDVREII